MWRVLLCAITLLLAMPSIADARTYAAIVQDFETGKVVHSRKADRHVYPASLTKMMTLYMLFEALEDGRLTLESKLEVSARAEGMPASKLGLRRGQTIRVKDAIPALVVKSANDVAVVVAEALGGTESKFAIRMTERAHAIGMTKTTFKNASGLPNRYQKTTARDMAKLATRLIRKYPDRYHYFASTKFSFNGRTYRSHNSVLRTYHGADGLKTGYIRASGFNLAASAVRNGRRVLAIVFGGKTAKRRDAQMVRLLDMGFERLPSRAPAYVLGPPRPRPHQGDPAAAPAPVIADLAHVTREIDLAMSYPKLPKAKPGESDLPSVTAGLNATGVSGDLPIVRAPELGDAQLSTNTPIVLAPQLATGPEKTAVRGSYGVQVGAYHNADRARRHAIDVAQLMPEILLRGDVDVSGLTAGRRTVYRSRLVGFERSVAERACAVLRRLNQECLVVRVDNVQVAASL